MIEVSDKTGEVVLRVAIPKPHVLPLPRDDGWYEVQNGVATFVPFRMPPDVEPPPFDYVDEPFEVGKFGVREDGVIVGPWLAKARRAIARFSPWGKQDPIEALTDLKGSGI